MKPTFDVSKYVLPFRVSASQGILMSTALRRRVPDAAPEAVRRASERVRKASAKVHAEWKARSQPRKVADLRVPLIAHASAWNALHGRISAWTKFSPGECPESAVAAELIAAVFPDKLGFLTGDPAQRWLTSDRKFELVTSEAHGDAFERLAGAFFVTALRRAHQDLGAALGMVGDVRPRPPSNDLRPLLQDLVQAIREYAIQVVAASDLASSEDIARLKHQLDPIETYRLRGESADVDDTADDEEEPANGATPSTKLPTQPANDARPADDKRRVA